MKGKIAVVTGANAGIGKETVRGLAEKGMTVYMICRSRERGEVARQELIRDTGNDHIYLRLCDFSSKASIQEYGMELRAELPHIDILVNNAGAIFGERRLSADGLEMSFALNHLGYFLHTHYLLDLLRKGTDKRIINVSSGAHKMVREIDFDDLQWEKEYKEMMAYAQSKLFNIYFTNELAKRLQNEGITANCLHPGVVATNFGQSGGKLLRALLPVGKWFMISAAKGAATSLHLATSPNVQGLTGKYFEKSKEAKTTTLAQDENHAARLWKISLALGEVKEYGKP